MKQTISNLHYITQEFQNKGHVENAELALKNGAEWIQLRVKNKNHLEWLELAKQTKELCLKYQAKLIINDNVSIALAVKADGIHLGKKDICPIEAKKILGKDFLIGGTANSLNDVIRLYACEVDYIGIGPFKPTITKTDHAPVLGLSGISDIITRINHLRLSQHYSIPLIAVGGINIEDVEWLIEKGVHGIAVSGAITREENKKELITQLKNKLKQEQR